MEQRRQSRKLSRRARNDDASSDDETLLSGAAATLRSIKRKHINSRSVSPTPLQQTRSPTGAQTSWYASTDDPPSPEAARQRQGHKHKQSQDNTTGQSGKATQIGPQKLRRKERKQSVQNPTPSPGADGESQSPIGHPSVSSAVSPIDQTSAPPSRGNQPGHDESAPHSPRSPSQWTKAESTIEEAEAERRTQHRNLAQPRPSSSHAEIHPPMVLDQLPPQSPNAEVDGPAPPVDPRKMLLLMRKTCGRMQGQLLHRERGSHTWIRSHCHIDAAAGSLISDDEIIGQHMCLFRNLRQCNIQAHLHTESNAFILQLTSKDHTQSLQLHPPDQLLFNAWFAALLCWKPVQPGQRLDDKERQQRPMLIRQISDYLPKVDPGVLANPIRKVGNAVLVEPDYTRAGLQTGAQGRFTVKTRWRSVSCTLNARGELRVHSKNLKVLASVILAELPRSAIQRLSATVLGADCVIAIYPQYGQNANACSRIRPIFLSFEGRELYEVWYVLMRAHAIPELFGASRMQAASESSSPTEFLPGIKQEKSPALFRMANVLRLQLKEAKIWSQARQSATPEPHEDSPRIGRNKQAQASYFAEILLDGQVKARSTFRFESAEPIWYENFEFSDLPNVFSTVSIRVKRQSLNNGSTVEDSPASSYAFDGQHEEAVHERPDIVCGEASVERSSFDDTTPVEGWYGLRDECGNPTGEVSIRLSFAQEVVLMDQEYDPISDLLHDFGNSLTLQICERIPDSLGHLSEALLNIFQVSGEAGNWLMYLAEEEIDGVREPAPGKARYTRRLESTESRESLNAAEREDMVRDMGRSATAEANLLFRGNTLLSKALDMHMRRLGRDYLETTLGNQLRAITVQDLDCEVDPSKISNSHNMQKNWARLTALTEQTWQLIAKSVKKCPIELRIIFRHIRACAADRYGDYLRSVPYSAVSGFLFLRFFCAAVLNPQLFMLIDSTPRPKAQRTYILLAKSLQGLANMTTFGHKEPWMSPMNTFLNGHRQAFKTFIDEICSVASNEQLPIPASYNIPYQIFQKSPLSSREGFPSLPYLIDRAQNLASLVQLWLNGVSSAANDGIVPPGASNSLQGDLARFHDFCLGLHQRTRAAYRSADRSAVTSASPLNHRWSAIALRMEVSPEEYWVKQRGERSRGEEGRARALSPFGRKLSAAKFFGHQSRSGSRGGREDTWKPLTIRRRAGSQPVAGPTTLGGEEMTAGSRHDASGTDGEGEELMALPTRESEHRPMTPQTSEDRENKLRSFWRKRGRTPDKRDSTL